MEETGLEVYTTDALLAEVQSRFTGTVFACVGDKQGDSGKEVYFVVWSGGPTMAKGLAARLANSVDVELDLAPKLEGGDEE